MFIIGFANYVYSFRPGAGVFLPARARYAGDLPVRAQTLKQANAAATAYFNKARHNGYPDMEYRYGGHPDIYSRDVWDENHKEA